MITNGEEDPLVKEFLDFVLSKEGQKIVGKTNYCKIIVRV